MFGSKEKDKRIPTPRLHYDIKLPYFTSRQGLHRRANGYAPIESYHRYRTFHASRFILSLSEIFPPQTQLPSTSSINFNSHPRFHVPFCTSSSSSSSHPTLMRQALLLRFVSDEVEVVSKRPRRRHQHGWCPQSQDLETRSRQCQRWSLACSCG